MKRIGLLGAFIGLIVVVGALYAPHLYFEQLVLRSAATPSAGPIPKDVAGQWFDDYFLIQQIDASTFAIGEPRYYQGNYSYLILGTRRALLFDAGSQSGGDLYRQTVQPALQQLGVKSIDRIFLSHANFDHFSAIGDLVRQVPVGQVCVGPTFRQDAGHNHAASLLQAEIELAGVPMNTLARPEKLAIEPGVSVEVLWPTATPPGHDNDASLVLKLNIRGRTILFCGDIQAKAEESLLARRGDLAATVLVAPHHGSAEETSAAFVKAAGSKLILAGSAARLSGKQVAFDQVVGSTPLVRTGRNGAITLRVQEDGKMSVDTWRTGLHWEWP